MLQKGNFLIPNSFIYIQGIYLGDKKLFKSVGHTTYIQNNYFNRKPINTPCPFGNNFYSGSLFGFGFGGCVPYVPPAPSFIYPPYGFSMPMLGSFCTPCPTFGIYNFGAMNKILDVFTLLGTVNAATNMTQNFFNGLSSYSRTRIPSSSASSRANTSSISTNTNLPQLENAGYDKEKGGALARDAANNAVGFTGYCAKYVRRALDRTGLGTGERGDGYEYASILSRNPNFKEISTDNLNLSLLPAGCILVYDRGVSGYSSNAGHVEVTLGNGQAVSDGVTNHIKNGARVFIPV